MLEKGKDVTLGMNAKGRQKTEEWEGGTEVLVELASNWEYEKHVTEE